jgi:hypothetical protein
MTQTDGVMELCGCIDELILCRPQYDELRVLYLRSICNLLFNEGLNVWKEKWSRIVGKNSLKTFNEKEPNSELTISKSRVFTAKVYQNFVLYLAMA